MNHLKDQPSNNLFRQWIAATDIIFLELLLLLSLIIQTKEWLLIGLALTTILYIVFGEDAEKSLKTIFNNDNISQSSKLSRLFFKLITFGIAPVLCRLMRDNIIHRVEGSREWVASVLLGLILFANGAINSESIVQVIQDKWEIIGLIMSFALMSYGIGKSGYFKYAAYRITESCGGSTTRLTLYLFVLTSVLTLITSNDIVILVLTPIIIQISYYAGIKNAKLLLLSQFVAANTLSMGLLIGSPTNIIFGTVLGYSFFDYIWLMIIPTICAFMISFIIVDYINKRSSKEINNSDWFFNNRYLLPTIDKKQNYTKEMTYWIGSFVFIILLVSVITSTNLALGWTIAGVIAVIVVIYAISSTTNQRTSHIKEHLGKSIKSLPFQIIPFALIFFVVTKELSNENLGLVVGQWIVSGDSFILVTMKSLFVSGGLVNLFNDLPTAAFLSNIIDPNIAGKDMVARAVLVGLNIGCYVTPIGALAGIIWFHQMKSETLNIKAEDENFEIQTPLRSGLFKYGVTHFMFVALILSFIIPAISHLHNVLIAPWDQPTYNITYNFWVVEMLGGIVLVFLLTLRFNDILRSNNVVLGDMRVFLGFMTWANAKNKEHSLGVFIIFFCIIVLAFLMPVFRIEEWGVDKYVWIPSMIGSGLELPESLIPKSTLGVIVVGILPLAFIAILVKLIAILSDDKTLEDISLQMATGKIQSHRVVAIGCQAENMSFIGNILKAHNNVFLTIIVNSKDKTEVRDFLNDINLQKESSSDYYVDILPKEDVGDIVLRFKIDKADEIYLFTDEAQSKEIANSIQDKLYDNKKQPPEPKLKTNERYPKIFSAAGIFDNVHANNNYVINLPSNEEVFTNIEQAIYKNNLECNNYESLKKICTS